MPLTRKSKPNWSIEMAQTAAATLKSPEAFRTISEVADILDVPQHVLRFWETRFAHIKPIKRAGGRRFYRPEDVNLLRGIRVLLYFEGYTIKGAQKVLREKGVRYVAELGRTHLSKTGACAARAEASNVTEFKPLARLQGDAPETMAREDVAEALAREDGDIAALDDARHARLETLLGELLSLKSRLIDARARVLI